jgi:hypothetical protein
MFIDPPPLAPILPGEGFPDHEAVRLLHVLPRGLVPVREADGTPRFALSRFRDTTIGAARGMMHLELDFATLDPDLMGAAATDGWDLRLAGFSAARARLRSHVPGLSGDGPLGPWSEAGLSSRTLLVEDHLFDANTAQMLDALLSSDAGDIEVEVEARYEGLEQPLPVLVSAELAQVAALLRASAPSYLLAEGVDQDAVEAAILSAVSGAHSPFRCEQLSGEPFADDAVLRRCLALAMRDDLFAVVAADDSWAVPRYRWRDGIAAEGRRSWDLSIPRRMSRIWQGRWSLRSLVRELSEEDRSALFPAFSAIAPFATVPVALIGPVGLDPRFVRRVQVDVLASGPGGVPQQRSFVYPPTPAFQRFNVSYPALTETFHLSAHVSATLSPLAGAVPALPRPLGRRPLKAGTAISWTAADAGFHTMAVSAMPGLFDRAARIEVKVADGDTLLCVASLTSDAPDATLAWETQSGTPAISAVAYKDEAGGPSVTLHEGAAHGSLLVRPEMLEVLDPETIRVSLDPVSIGNAAYAAITLADPTGRKRSFSLDAGEVFDWPCWRRSRFDPLSYQYRVQHIPRLPDGTTLPLVSGDWLRGQAPELRIILQPAGVDA